MGEYRSNSWKTSFLRTIVVVQVFHLTAVHSVNQEAIRRFMESIEDGIVAKIQPSVQTCFRDTTDAVVKAERTTRWVSAGTRGARIDPEFGHVTTGLANFGAGGKNAR